MNNSEVINYRHKYQKYLTKYLARITSANADRTISGLLDEFMENVKKKPLTPVSVDQIADFFELAVRWSYDTERMHKLEDSLANRFIIDVANNNYDPGVQKIIATKIKAINDKGYHKWFD